MTARPPAAPAAERLDRLGIVAYDPGETTGWARILVEKQWLPEGTPVSLKRAIDFRCGQFGNQQGLSEDDQADMMRHLARQAWVDWAIDGACDTFVVVVEDFILRVLQRDRSLLAPVRITAKFEYAMRESRVRIRKQSPSDAKNVVTDARLKLWNVYSTGSGVHARDAQRHAILGLRTYAADPKVRAWAGVGLR